jgi:hypothetical protein
MMRITVAFVLGRGEGRVALSLFGVGSLGGVGRMSRSTEMRAGGISRARMWGAFIGALVMLSLLAPRADAATAANSYAFSTSFGDGASGFTVPAFNGISVEASTGNVFVAEAPNSKVSVYAPDATLGGLPLTTFAVAPALGTNVAADPSNGSVYVVDGLFGGLTKWVSDGQPTPTYSFDPSFSPPYGSGGIAVDPVTHDVLFGDNGTQVYRLDSATGAVLSSFDGSDTATGTFGFTAGLAVGPTGAIYVIDGSRPRVERMSSGGASQGSLPLIDGATPIGVAVNSQSGEVDVVEAVSDGGYVLEGFTPSGQRVFSTRLPGAVSGTPFGIADDPTTGRIYLVNDSGTVFTFVPAIQPGVDAPVVSQLTGTGAHVSANVDSGGETTTARIEYCLASAACASYPASDPADSANPWVRVADHAGLSGASEQTITDDLTGLSPNTTYKVRVHAENALTDNTSSSITFTSAVVPPGVTTGPASDVKGSSAVLAGTIDTIGDQTTYHFEYGLTTDYGNAAPAGAKGVAGNSRTPRTFTRPVTGLRPGTTYHYRFVARNSGGQAAGADRTFTTLLGDSAATRAYEQVSPPDKRGASLDTVYGFHAAADGSGIEYIGSATSSDAGSSPQLPRFMSRRGASDWLDWKPLDPPMAVSREIVSSITLAVSNDFDHSMVVSNRALAPGASDQGANLYMVDVPTGHYSLIGKSTASSAFIGMGGIQRANMFLAGAPDFSWIVFDSMAPLLPGVTGPAMYKWTKAGGLTVESRLPDGSVATGNVQMQGASVLATHEVSDDGNTMYFALTTGENGVYRRSNGTTTAISVSHRAGDPATPQLARLDGVSSDGRYAFFHGTQLTDDAPPAFGNLYRYDSVTNDLTFIATLSFDFGGDGTNDVTGVGADGRTVYFHSGSHTMVWHDGQIHQVSPDPFLFMFPSANGRYIAWLGSDTNAYLYDAVTNQSSCMSCPADGSPGGNAKLPEPNRNISNRVPVAVTDDGLGFFDTTVRLVSADHNGTRDVYSYRDGTLTLISPGDQAFDAGFADASAEGHDVFFGTAQPLVGRDNDEAADIYDARIGGGFPNQSPTPPPADCAKNECSEPTRGPVTSPPVVASPQPPGAPKQRSNQARVSLSLAKVSVTSSSVHISFRASQRGRVRVTGSRVSTTVRNVSKAGTYSIVVPLSKTARTLRHAHKKFKVAVKVTLSGGWGSASAKYSRTLGK